MPGPARSHKCPTSPVHRLGLRHPWRDRFLRARAQRSGARTGCRARSFAVSCDYDHEHEHGQGTAGTRQSKTDWALGQVHIQERSRRCGMQLDRAAVGWHQHDVTTSQGRTARIAGHVHRALQHGDQVTAVVAAQRPGCGGATPCARRRPLPADAGLATGVVRCHPLPADVDGAAGRGGNGGLPAP